MAAPPGTVPRTDCPGRLLAHRGASRVAPENTLAAFRAAATQGARWIEFDVSLLGDGTPVVHHDATFERCTDGRGPLAAAGLADLDALDAGVRFGARYPREPVPTLEAVLDLIETLGLSANLEMKVHAREERELAAAVAAALGRRPWAAARVLVSSFDAAALRHLRGHRPEQPLAMLWEALPRDWQPTVEALAATAVHLDWRWLSTGQLRALRADGAEVRVYTINRPRRVAALREQGLTGVITDHPPLFLDRADWAAWAAR